MNQRENLLSLCRREGFESVPVEFVLCPSLTETYRQKVGGGQDYMDYFQMPWRPVRDGSLPRETAQFLPYYPALKPDAEIDLWGVAHERGSAAAMHMTRMLHPLENAESEEDIAAYPFPAFETADYGHQRAEVAAIHARGLAAVGFMQCTIWETAWYLRGMENLMMDMMAEEPMAVLLLDRVTRLAIARAQAFARAGADIISLGDDIGMQRSTMMSGELYRAWLKPRLKQVVDAIRAVKPDTLVFYHSCGYVTPFIDDLIDVGIDVLNPLQSECMDFAEIHAKWGDRLSFHGTIGTQTTMPFGSPSEVRELVKRNLDAAGKAGGLFVAPTHMLEPETPWENIMAYVEACLAYR